MGFCRMSKNEFGKIWVCHDHLGRVQKHDDENFYYWINHRQQSCGKCATLKTAKKKASHGEKI